MVQGPVNQSGSVRFERCQDIPVYMGRRVVEEIPVGQSTRFFQVIWHMS